MTTLETTTPEDGGFSWPFFALGMSVGVLAGAAIRGSTVSRIAALLGFVALVGAVGLGVASRRRAHDEGAPPTGELFTSWLAESGRFFLYLFTYGAIVLLIALDDEPGPLDGTWGEAVFVALAAACLSIAVLRTARDLWRTEGVERRVLLESTSVAFFATILGVSTYAMAEVLSDAPTLPMWAVGAFALFSWLASWTIVRRRVS